MAFTFIASSWPSVYPSHRQDSVHSASTDASWVLVPHALSLMLQPCYSIKCQYYSLSLGETTESLPTVWEWVLQIRCATNKTSSNISDSSLLNQAPCSLNFLFPHRAWHREAQCDFWNYLLCNYGETSNLPPVICLRASPCNLASSCVYYQQLLFLNCLQKHISEVKLIREHEEKAHKAGWATTYRYFHRLHGEVTWRLQSLGSGSIPEGGERCKSSKSHECVGRKGAHILPDVKQLWHSKIPEQFMDFHGTVLLVL